MDCCGDATGFTHLLVPPLSIFVPHDCDIRSDHIAAANRIPSVPLPDCPALHRRETTLGSRRPIAGDPSSFVCQSQAIPTVIESLEWHDSPHALGFQVFIVGVIKHDPSWGRKLGADPSILFRREFCIDTAQRRRLRKFYVQNQQLAINDSRPAILENASRNSIRICPDPVKQSSVF